ncbi:MAG TPA: deaminase [Candidatus Omnitrophota bacterium]|nr:deaminase [Candidatus Omnitrophota bacterium]
MQKEIGVIPEGALGTRPSWDEFFMGMAIWYSSRRSCRHVRSGSVITQNNEVIGMGYNGAPHQIKENCLDFGCRKEVMGLDYKQSLNSGNCIGIHSEKNAAGHLIKIGLKEIVLYNAIFPCHTCAKDMLPYGLSKVIFKRLYSEKETESTLELFGEAGVNVYRLDLSPERYLDILFGKPAETFDAWSDEERERIKALFSLK